MSDAAFTFVSVAAMVSGVFLIFMAMRQRSDSLERQHRERMAMIERGHVPPAAAVARASARAMSLGIIVVGLGLALTMIVSVAGGAPGAGIGVGGAIVILGLAFIVRALVVRSAPEDRS
jgi:hypothetical protein